ncbi:hypothetical protein HOU03_gp375 [Caulobacter phage CcrSC]|uniref:Uncharacterized protein n=1 Tax=Caulobacter phage CcrSC TaxID=2283272 RepID=A0A385EDP8_9CAUD|nr:hypothetical protein HOU03_gp375 [Caulobacter phage CcrSC]AXQ69893.1 hypothetical protein CcrSC_gp311 [Caulobacter phage CcrSC]
MSERVLVAAINGDRNRYYAEPWCDPWNTWAFRWKVYRHDRLPCEGRMSQYIGEAASLMEARKVIARNIRNMRRRSRLRENS